jgi:hypothetical protein
MKTAKNILKIGFLCMALLILWGIYRDRTETQEMFCQTTYMDFDTEIRAALSAEGVDKLAHLQAAHMVMQMLYQKDCCRFEKTCPAGLQL